MQPWFITSFFYIEHSCYGQLTPVKTRYPLTSITWPYRRLRFRAQLGHCCFWSWPLTKSWFSIGFRALVRFTCWKRGRVVRKPINASPGLKVNQRIFIFFLVYKCFSLLLLCLVLDYSNSKQKDKRYTENLTAKFQNSDQNSRLSWVSWM